jgi:hypothetical protein
MRLRGQINSQDSTRRGGWIRANQQSWYFQWCDAAPGVRRSADDSVEFDLTTDARGRPIAINVTPFTNP